MKIRSSTFDCGRITGNGDIDRFWAEFGNSMLPNHPNWSAGAANQSGLGDSALPRLMS